VRGDLIEVGFARLKSKTKWMHVMSPPRRWVTSRAASGQRVPSQWHPAMEARSRTRRQSGRRNVDVGRGS
jgi:hypothetical protein